MDNTLLKTQLDRFVLLLESYHEEHWHAYFRKAREMMERGECEAAKRAIRAAYGGMGSISDSLAFNGAPQTIAEEGFELRASLYSLSKPGSLLQRLRNFCR
jgi:hypothetical protein